MRIKTLNDNYFDSFDRFCDDLCELLLSFLPISDKIEFECVSKQWKRLIFNKQQKLIITFSENKKYTIKKICYARDISQIDKYCINIGLLEKVFVKFKYITHLEINTGKDYTFEFYFEPILLKMIGAYCPFLNRFECNCWGFDISEENFNHFGLICGQRLEYFRYDHLTRKRLIAFMPSNNRIKALHMRRNPLNAKDLIEERFSKLEEISFRLSDYQNMALFTDNFHSKINKLCIHFDRYYMTENKNNDCLDKFVVLKN